MSNASRKASAGDIPQQRSLSWGKREEEDIAYLRALAREGTLAATYAAATPEQRRRLTGAAMLLAAPVVFSQLTRAIELRRAHTNCASGSNHIGDACIDFFHDDVEAVTFDVLRNSTRSITNVEGWMARRVRAATIDAHRRRRGARGAQQRPRLPRWLKQGLGDDPWLGQLAVEILTWVGVSATAGRSLWPLDGWTDLRAAFRGARTPDDTRTVEREVERVLAVMRTRPDWYRTYVERPLGAKCPPVAAVSGDGAVDEPQLLSLVEPHELIEAKLTETAEVALQAIERQAEAGTDLTAAVVAVLNELFGVRAVQHDLDAVPHAGTTAGERVAALTADPEQLAGLVQVVHDILASGR